MSKKHKPLWRLNEKSSGDYKRAYAKWAIKQIDLIDKYHTMRPLDSVVSKISNDAPEVPMLREAKNNYKYINMRSKNAKGKVQHNSRRRTRVKR